MQRRLAAFLATAAGSMFVLAGCGGGGDSSDDSTQTIVGRWRLTRATGQVGAVSQSLTCPGSVTIPAVGTASCSASDVVEYKSDGTFTATGTLAASGNGFTLPGDGAAQSVSGTWRQTGNSLVLTTPSTDAAGTVSQPTVVGFSNNNTQMTIQAAVDAGDALPVSGTLNITTNFVRL